MLYSVAKKLDNQVALTFVLRILSSIKVDAIDDDVQLGDLFARHGGDVGRLLSSASGIECCCCFFVVVVSVCY